MNLLERLCRELEIEIGKEWEGTDGNIYKIEEDGTLVQINEFTVLDATTAFKSVEDIKDILTGKIKPRWKPIIGEMYYVPCLDNGVKCTYAYWKGDYLDKWRYSNGLAFNTKQEAQNVAQEMITLTKHGGR